MADDSTRGSEKVTQMQIRKNHVINKRGISIIDYRISDTNVLQTYGDFSHYLTRNLPLEGKTVECCRSKKIIPEYT